MCYYSNYPIFTKIVVRHGYNTGYHPFLLRWVFRATSGVIDKFRPRDHRPSIYIQPTQNRQFVRQYYRPTNQNQQKPVGKKNVQ